MRFSDRITFVIETETRYDPSTGGYIEGELIKVTKPCKLSTMGTDRTQQLFGTLDKHITIARLQHPYIDSFDYVLIDNRKYNVKRQSDYRKGVFYLEGIL